MKDVIDVMELQREKIRRVQPLDYRQLDFADGFTPARFIFECGIKLHAQPLTVATAAVLMHRFFKEVDQSNYDCYVSTLTYNMFCYSLYTNFSLRAMFSNSFCIYTYLLFNCNRWVQLQLSQMD